ncbi:MAG: hypothetical protein K9G49_03640 [Taibaiella sp.]|nr:hypothetical protein [Taibaiella sp.]
MIDKFKKIDRQYVLSDSSVNEYGFRLLTSGYQIDSFRKNPIGYYMHQREDGIALKWEDLHINDDKVIGTPVVNLANSRGEQTCNEAENGFLNAASVGHIVVLEYSMDKEMMLPGQTGPTITKWYNKECSLVDIPGNCNALTRLYDVNENMLNLVDMNIGKPLTQMPKSTIAQLNETLQLSDNSNENELVLTVQNLVAKTQHLETENKALSADKHKLQQQLDEINNIRRKYEITALLDRALEDKKITTELRGKLAADYAANPEGLKALLAAMPAYRTIAEQLNSQRPDMAEAQWEWDDYEKKDPAGNKLKDLRANDPVRYKELFERKFAA